MLSIILYMDLNKCKKKKKKKKAGAKQINKLSWIVQVVKNNPRSLVYMHVFVQQFPQ